MPGLTLELFLNIDPNNFDTVSQILDFVWKSMSISAFFIAHLFFALLLAYLTKYFGIPKKEAN